MGIPSFYRQLCRKFPQIITKGVGPSAEWLCLDFNCAMYWVLRQMRPLSDNQHMWEGELCDNIAAYMTELVRLAAPTKGVFVSCDGVVCAAKRRQQRLRRFKGPWIATQESALLGKSTNSGWDQNALTPGSAFMDRLGRTLTAAGVALASSTGLEVIVSTTAAAGEGEHKLLAHMRMVKPRTCMIYGLDADLILLSMLLKADTGADVSLLREAQEFEKGGSGWRTLSITAMYGAMFRAGSTERHVRDFVAAMSLLGNDFLPHSLTRTVRDDGIPHLMSTLQKHVWAAGQYLVDEAGNLRHGALMAILGAWAITEEGDMLAAAIDAAKMRNRPVGEGDTPAETALREWNAQPARWASLTRLLAPGRSNGLRDNWRDIYRSKWHAGSPTDYIAGVAWVWDYYSGRPVDQAWMFEAHLPPLWSDLLAVTTVAPPPVLYPTPLTDWVHLLAVLPADSVRRLLPRDKQVLMDRAPWYWPSQWSLFDVGRSQMWECEPVVPMIAETVLRNQS